MRSAIVVFACAVLGCGGPPAGSAPPNAAGATPKKNPENPLVRPDLHCTMSGADDEKTCRARGPAYSLQAPLHCYGTDPGPEMREKERLAYEASTEACACISPVEIEQCSMVP